MIAVNRVGCELTSGVDLDSNGREPEAVRIPRHERTGIVMFLEKSIPTPEEPRIDVAASVVHRLSDSTPEGIVGVVGGGAGHDGREELIFAVPGQRSRAVVGEVAV